MMRRLLILVLLFISSTNLLASNLEAWFDHKVFYIPGEGSYVETHLSFTGESLKYQTQSDGTLMAEVQSTIIIKKGETIIDFRKVNVQSPSVTDSTKVDFMDIQRFSLENGSYSFEIELEDMHFGDQDKKKLAGDFTVSALEEGMFVSDITFVKAYAKAEEPGELTKSGYNLLPYVSNYFPSRLDAVVFYAEGYNSDKYFGENEMFILAVRVEELVSRKTVDGIGSMKRTKTGTVNPLLQTLDISELPKGEYNLVLEMRDKKNNTIASRSITFQRNNYVANPTNDDLAMIDVTKTFAQDYQNREELLEYINSLRPIASSLEQSTIHHQMENADLTLLQQYFYHFWVRRYDEDPEQAWLAYKKEVDLVNGLFGTGVTPGYQTDRGRIYLQYGKPNTIVQKHFTENVWPYEIWHFYELGVHNDKRFLFYDPTALAQDFVLLHSDLPGEIQNFDWRQIMRGRRASSSVADSQFFNMDQNTNYSYEGEELEDLFFNPR